MLETANSNRPVDLLRIPLPPLLSTPFRSLQKKVLCRFAGHSALPSKEEKKLSGPVGVPLAPGHLEGQ